MIHPKYANAGSATTDIVAVNAAAALFTSDIVNSIPDGMELAYSAIEDGSSFETLHKLIEYTEGNQAKLDRLISAL